MNKKQIEEMAKDLRTIDRWREYPTPEEYAEELIKLGWIKPNENSVVISKEEYERLKTAVGEFVTESRAREIAIEYKNMYVKETAERIYAYVNCFGTHNWERFKNFLKQFGVDLGEDK